MSSKHASNHVWECLPDEPEPAGSQYGANFDGDENRYITVKECNEKLNALMDKFFTLLDKIPAMIVSEFSKFAKEYTLVAAANDSNKNNKDTSTKAEQKGNEDTPKDSCESVSKPLTVPNHKSSRDLDFCADARKTGMNITREHSSYVEKAIKYAPHHQASATAWSIWVRNKAEILDELYDRSELRIHVWINIRAIIPAKYLIGYQDRRDVVDDYHHIVKHLKQYEHQALTDKSSEKRLRVNTFGTWNDVNDITETINEIINHHKTKEHGVTSRRLKRMISESWRDPRAARFAGAVMEYANKLEDDDTKLMKDLAKDTIRTELIMYYDEVTKSRSKKKSSTAEPRYYT